MGRLACGGLPRFNPAAHLPAGKRSFGRLGEQTRPHGTRLALDLLDSARRRVPRSATTHGGRW